jgi:FCP1-like phosphatase family protein
MKRRRPGKRVPATARAGAATTATGKGRTPASAAAQSTCTHPVLITSTLCGVCGAILGNTSSVDVIMRARQINVSGGHALSVSRAEATRMSTKEIGGLLSDRKLCCVLDLDATLLHATIRKSEQVNALLARASAWDAADPTADPLRDERRAHVFTMKGVCHYIKLRPGLYEFLDRMASKYVLYVYTHGTRAYAENVCRIIDPSHRYFQSRILSRSDTPGSEKTKELSRLFPTTQSMVCIVDDRDDVWTESLGNLFKIEPFVHWKDAQEVNNKTGESLAPTKPEDDVHLDHCWHVMDRVHQAFYGRLPALLAVEDATVHAQLRGEGPSLPAILTAARKSVLAGCNIVLTSVLPSTQSVVRSKLCRFVYFFGGTVSLEVGPGVTHVVAGRPGTEKCVQGLAMGCHIVRKEWLDDSMARWIRRPEAAYTFPDLKRYESTTHPPGSAPFKPGLLLQYHVPKAPPPAFSEEEEDDDEEGATLGGSVEEEEEGESQKRRRIHSVEEECGEGSNIDGDDSSEEEYDDEEVDVTDFY